MKKLHFLMFLVMTLMLTGTGGTVMAEEKTTVLIDFSKREGVPLLKNLLCSTVEL